MRNISYLFVLAGLAGLLAAGELTPVQAQNAHQNNGGQFPDLVGGLKATEGCLGVETAQTTSGKRVIFAWFENKAAVLNWYYSDMHIGVMKSFFPGHEPGKPMEEVPDELGPIMVIASITFTDKQNFKETNLPVSQIAIEMYTPITGGLFLGGRFAPEGVTVSNMKDYTPGK